jgi:hypothetical protein
MKALTADQRKELGRLEEHAIAAITASRDLSDGYAFRVDPAKASLLDVARWLDIWRRCCPFYEFQIDFHAVDANLWLSVKGVLELRSTSRSILRGWQHCCRSNASRQATVV